MASAVLEAVGLTKRYRKITALRNVDISVPDGITAIYGPNAAGKSTLLKTWIGFEQPSAGRVMVLGKDPWRDASATRHVGYVPQATVLYRDLTVADHLVMASRLRRDFDRAAAVARLSRIGLPARARAGELSGGQQAQVAIAVALGLRAKVLLLDEPLAALDPLARREFVALLEDIVSEGRASVIVSSHIVDDVASLGGRVIVLGVGRVLYQGAIDEALSTHRVVEGEEPLFAAPVGSFVTRTGATIHLVRESISGRVPTVEELVLGYLASSRPAAEHNLGWGPM